MPITTEPKGPKPPLPGLVKVDLMYSGVTITSLKAHNIMHLLLNPVTTLSAANMAILATDFINAWNSNLTPILSNQYQVGTCTTTMLDGTGTEGFASTTIAGGGTSAPLPPQCAVCITWKASFSWRGGRPRTYLGGITGDFQNSVADSKLAPAKVATLETAVSAFLTAVNAITVGGATVALGFPSYYSKGAFRTPPLFFPFTGHVVHERLDSQRRRSGKESLFGVG